MNKTPTFIEQEPPHTPTITKHPLTLGALARQIPPRPNPPHLSPDNLVKLHKGLERKATIVARHLGVQPRPTAAVKATLGDMGSELLISIYAPGKTRTTPDYGWGEKWPPIERGFREVIDRTELTDPDNNEPRPPITRIRSDARELSSAKQAAKIVKSMEPEQKRATYRALGYSEEEISQLVPEVDRIKSQTGLFRWSASSALAAAKYYGVDIAAGAGLVLATRPEVAETIKENPLAWLALGYAGYGLSIISRGFADGRLLAKHGISSSLPANLIYNSRRRKDPQFGQSQRDINTLTIRANLAEAGLYELIWGGGSYAIGRIPAMTGANFGAIAALTAGSIGQIGIEKTKHRSQ